MGGQWLTLMATPLVWEADTGWGRTERSRCPDHCLGPLSRCPRPHHLRPWNPCLRNKNRQVEVAAHHCRATHSLTPGSCPHTVESVQVPGEQVPTSQRRAWPSEKPRPGGGGGCQVRRPAALTVYWSA